MAENGLESVVGDGDRDRCTVKRSDLDGMTLGVAVPATVAAKTGANVLDLDPLAGVVDVDALDDVWEPVETSQWDPGTRVTFPYMGYEVSVTPEEFHLVPLEDGSVDGGGTNASD